MNIKLNRTFLFVLSLVHIACLEMMRALYWFFHPSWLSYLEMHIPIAAVGASTSLATAVQLNVSFNLCKNVKSLTALMFCP